MECSGTDRSVFAQLAQRGKRFLVCLSNPFDHPLRFRTQHVDLHALRLLVILLLFVPIVPHCYRGDTRGHDDYYVEIKHSVNI